MEQEEKGGGAAACLHLASVVVQEGGEVEIADRVRELDWAVSPSSHAGLSLLGLREAHEQLEPARYNNKQNS
jgi:hypothetical protein